MKDCSAFSLLELLITISIIIFCCSFAVPAISTLIASAHARSEILQLRSAIHFARASALKYSQPIIFCKSIDHKTCSGTWSDGQIIFIDHNKHHQVEQGDTILRVFQKIPYPGKLIWSGFGSKDYFQVNSTGFLQQQNGTFYYCAGDKNSSLNKSIIISKSGRVRMESMKKNNSFCK